MAGTYDPTQNYSDLQLVRKEIDVDLDLEQYFTLSIETKMRSSDLSVISVILDTQAYVSGTIKLSNVPDVSELLGELGFESYPGDIPVDITIAYTDYTINFDVDAGATVSLTFLEDLPIIRFPLCEGSCWSGTRDARIDVDYYGTADVSGLPSELVELLTMMNITFPIDLLEMDEELGDGHIEDNVEVPYGGSCTNVVNGTTYMIAPGMGGVNLGIEFEYTPDGLLTLTNDPEMISNLTAMLENITGRQNMTEFDDVLPFDIPIDPTSIEMGDFGEPEEITAAEAKDKIDTIQSNLEAASGDGTPSEDGGFLCLSYLTLLTSIIPMIGIGIVMLTGRRKQK